MKPVCFFATTVTIQFIYINRDKIATKCASVYNCFLKWLGKEPASLIETRTPTEIYIEQQMHRFLKSYDTDQNFNANIGGCFYKKEDLAKALVDANSPTENEWKRRMLYESTPRGNIIMYYDPYKLGFVYYSDTSTISPKILNAAAMKYSITYRCRDFFVDNSVTPDGRHSALIPIHYIEKPKQVEASIDKSTAPKLDNSAFAKFKNYNKQTDKSHPNRKKDAVNTSTEQIKTVPTREECKNRFIYMGKTNNLQLTQPVKKYTNNVNGFSSQYLNDLKGETQLQARVLSYKDFKRTNMSEQ